MVKKTIYIPRRQVVRGLLGLTAFGVVNQLAACTPEANQSGQSGGSVSSPTQDLIIGFIYVGPKDDFGYNQAHAEGAAAIAKLPKVKILEEASVPETTAVYETMRSMIEQSDARVLFPTSFGYFNPHVLKIAKEFPEVQFFHAGGLYEEGKTPKNIGSYFGYIDEAQYISGFVAASTSKTNKLGFVAAKPIPQVLRNINSFTLGAKSAKPDITTRVIFTGDWAVPVKEAEATNSMADQSIDVVTCHVDSPKVVMETAERRGIFCTGYHANQSKLAPKGYLTGAEWDWETVYTNYVKDIQAGKTLMNGGIPNMVRGGLKEGFWKLSPYGPAVSDATKAAADKLRDEFKAGTKIIYGGELKDNQGKVVVAKDQKLDPKAVELEKMNWLVEGVIGSIS